MISLTFEGMFTIAIPAYKSLFLYDAIQSCLSQTFKDFEVVIVNDASPEDIDSVVDSFDDDRIKYFKNEKNNGAINVVDTWNQCLSYASGKYVICMGDDDMLLPNCLQDYYYMIEQYPSVDVLHTRTEIIDESNNVIAVQEERPLWESALSMLKERWDRRWRQFIGDFCFKTSSLKALGGFYKLPLAWSSDDISVFRAALTDGIVNVQTFGFQYRDNPQTISNSSSQKLKATANILAKDWFLQLFESLHKSGKYDNRTLCLLETQAVSFHHTRVLKLMLFDLGKSIFNICWWLANKQVVELSYSEILKGGFYCIKSSTKHIILHCKSIKNR